MSRSTPRDTTGTPHERLAELERENAQLRAAIDSGSDVGAASATAGKKRSTGGKWRAPLSAFLIVLAAITAPLAVAGYWGNAQLTNTEKFVSEFAPLASDPAVQRLVTDQATAAVEDAIDIPALTSAALDGLTSAGTPPQAVSAVKALEGPLNLGLTNLIRSTVDNLVTSDAFANTWATALRITHSQLLKTASGADGATVAIGDDGTLGIQLGPVISEVRGALVASGLGVAAMIPETDLTVPIATDVSLSSVHQGYTLAVAATAWLPIAALALLVLGVLVARNKRRALIGAAIGVGIAMAVILLALQLAKVFVPTSVPLPSDAIEAILSAATDPIANTSAALLTLAVLLVLVSWAAGPSSLATKLRALSQAATSGLRRIGDRYGLSTGAFGRWCEAWQRVLRIAIAVVAGLIVFFVRPITPGFAIGVLALSVLALLVLDVVRRPAELDAGDDAVDPALADAAATSTPTSTPTAATHA